MSVVEAPAFAPEDPGAQDFPDFLQEELEQGLMLYRATAEDILNGSGTRLHPLSPGYLSLENNFFSALFLYSYFRAGLPGSKRVLYVAINQCLRGMVTGCDNILDNEYKKTLDTDLPSQATKFRSVVDIMVSDRILTAVMHRGYQDGDFSFDDILQANTASLHALMRSGIQEASEEDGAGDILKPEAVLSRVHPLKTGILFQAPWVLPELMEKTPLISIEDIKEGLFHIGMGCQILDDMVDLSMDARMNRHNYVASLIRHGEDASERKILRACLGNADNVSCEEALLVNFPAARAASSQKALFFLEKGTRLLFAPGHAFMIPYTIDFFIKRIGAHRFFKS